VSVASVVKWSQRFRATGSAAAKPMRGRPGLSLAPHRAWLLTRLASAPDVTLRSLVVELGERGVTTSYGAVWRIVHAAGLSFKKTLFATEQDRPDVARRRARWKAYQHRLDPERLVFIAETWAKTNMTPLRGWAPRGRKLVAKAPQGRWRTLTFLAALRSDRIEAPCVIDGPIDGESFLAYVEQILVPTLRPGDVVIMDNLGSHKRQAIRQYCHVKTREAQQGQTTPLFTLQASRLAIAPSHPL
jgi:transposase